MKLILLGGIVMACFVLALLFARSWVRTRDRFFLWFAISFTIAGVGRFLLGVLRDTHDQTPLIYLTQLAAYLVILYAIWDKNRVNTKNPEK